MAQRTVAIIAIGILAMFAALILPRTRPTATAANRILNQYKAVEAPMLRLPPDTSWQRVDYFLGKLKAIDTDDAPEDVQRAMIVMVTAVEANVHVRRV